MLNYRSKPSQDEIFIKIAIWGANLVLCSAPKFGPHPGGSYGGRGGLSFYVGGKGRQWTQISHRKLKISISHDVVILASKPDAMLTEGPQLDGPKLNQPKWKFSIFCGLYGTTSYPQLPLRRIDPTDTRSHPQGGVQVYPKGKSTRQNHEKKLKLPPHQFLLNSHIR